MIYVKNYENKCKCVRIIIRLDMAFLLWLQLDQHYIEMCLYCG